ncbi:MAG: multidrug resistance protein [Chloroflexota bacterium]
MKQLSLLLVTVGLNVAGQYLMKRGMSDLGPIVGSFMEMAQSLSRAFLNPWVIGGLGAYGFSTFCWLVLLSRVDLSYAYPALSLGYLLITLVSFLVLGEQVSPMRWGAVLIICFGVFLVSQS